MTPPDTLIIVTRDPDHGELTATVAGDATMDELGAAMVAVFAEVAGRPDANIMQLQMSMMRAMQQLPA